MASSKVTTPNQRFPDKCLMFSMKVSQLLKNALFSFPDVCGVVKEMEMRIKIVVDSDLRVERK